MPTYYYTDKQERDRGARELAGLGRAVTRRSRSNVQLDPSRVNGAKTTDADRNAFGGYSPRYFAKLYIIEVR